MFDIVHLREGLKIIRLCNNKRDKGSYNNLKKKKPGTTGLNSFRNKENYSDSFLPYFLLNFSTRPAVSNNFCLPVKNGCEALEISSLTSG
jgi:hypothetical protein